MTENTLGTGVAGNLVPLDDVANLRSILGKEFVEWILAADSNGPLSPKQREVASSLISILRMYSEQNPEVPIGHLGHWLPFYHEPSGTTFINNCRLYVGGTIERPTRNSSDKLLDAILALAGECYGEMLIQTDGFVGAPTFFNYAKTNIGRQVVWAIYDEGIFPLVSMGADQGDADSEYLVRSVMCAGFASGLIWSAWNLAKLESGTPTPDQLASKVPVALEQLRSMFSGRVTKVTAVASFTGVRLPADTEISGKWGRLRPARRDDHPTPLRGFIDKRTTTTTAAGDQIEISDAGDVILETDVRVRVHVNKDDSGYRTEGIDDFDEIIDKVRLAFALAIARPTNPIIYTMWSSAFLPIGRPEALPRTDPRFMAPRMPTLLSIEEIASWKYWIEVATDADTTHLKVAITRTLKAISERLDPSDRLIDAVISWEALFGATNESTLRVSASLARLLHPSDGERESKQKEYQKIYSARSNIVHANKTKTTVAQVDEYGRAAAEVSLKAMGLILTTYDSLLPLESSARSTQVLLSDNWSSGSGSSSPGENRRAGDPASLDLPAQ
jgi:Apea-like HEPN